MLQAANTDLTHYSLKLSIESVYYFLYKLSQQKSLADFSIFPPSALMV